MLNTIPEGVRVRSRKGWGSHTKQSEYMVTPVEVVSVVGSRGAPRGSRAGLGHVVVQLGGLDHVVVPLGSLAHFQELAVLE